MQAVPKPEVIDPVYRDDHVAGEERAENEEELVPDSTRLGLEDGWAIFEGVAVFPEERGGDRPTLAMPFPQIAKPVSGMTHGSVVRRGLDSDVTLPGS